MSTYPNNPPPYPPMSPPPEFSDFQLPPKGQREYSIFGAMVRAPFFNNNVYRDVARNWKGIGFWYLFLLLLITWSIWLVKVHLGFAAFVRNDFPKLVQDVPPVTITNGHVTSPVEQPYFVKDSRNGKTMAVIDTTGTIKSMDDTDANLLVTDHTVWMRSNRGTQIRQYDLTKYNIKYFYIDKTKIIGWADNLTRWLAFGLLPIVFIGELILRLLQALGYASINMAFSAAFGSNLSFAAAMRLAIISVTPIILLDTIILLSHLSVPFGWLIGFLISLLYMGVAVRANANPAPPPTGGFPAVWPPQPANA